MGKRARRGKSEGHDEGVPQARLRDQCAISQAAEEDAGLGDEGRPGLWDRRRASLASLVVWRAWLLSLAGVQELQDAHAGLSLALALLHPLPDL